MPAFLPGAESSTLEKLAKKKILLRPLSSFGMTSGPPSVAAKLCERPFLNSRSAKSIGRKRGLLLRVQRVEPIGPVLIVHRCRGIELVPALVIIEIVLPMP